MRSFLLVLLAMAAMAGEGDTYRSVLAAMTAHAHRQPGSPGWEASAQAVEAALRQAGLEPHRQRYRTLVPRTRTCRLEIDGVEIPGLLAMAPNGVVPPTTWGRDLTGQAVWLGDGTLAEMQGVKVEGAIVFLRLSSPNLPQVFAQGAKAVIAVGDEATQWQAARLLTQAPIASPRAWLPRATAETHGLTANGGAPRQARLHIDVRWEDVETANIWAMLPAAAGAKAPGQTLILSAELATSGAVPDFCPGPRQAANAALLCELAGRLATQPLQRNVAILLLGSHYAGQDGVRNFYWGVHKATLGDRDPDPIAKREAWATEQITVAEARLALLSDPEVLARPGVDPTWIRERLRRLLVGLVNTRNYGFRKLNLEGQRLDREGDETGRAANAAATAELKAAIRRLNDLRGDLHGRRIQPERLDLWTMTIATVRDELNALRYWLRTDQHHLADAKVVVEAFTGRATVSHAGIDFADPSRPWLANPFAMDAFATFDLAPMPGRIYKHVENWQKAWNLVAARHPGSAGMISPESSVAYGFELLNHPRRRLSASVAPINMGLMGAQLVTLGDPLNDDELPTARPAAELLPLADRVVDWTRSLTGLDNWPAFTEHPIGDREDDKLVWRWDGSRWAGLRVDRLSPGSRETEGPAAGALLFINHPRHNSPFASDGENVCGRYNGVIARVNPVGHVFAPFVVSTWPSNVPNVHGIEFGTDGAPNAFYDGRKSTAANAFNIRLFTGYGNAFYTPFLPLDYSREGSFQNLIGRMDSQVKYEFGRAGTGGAVIYSEEERALKFVGSGLFLLGSTAERPHGAGLPPDPLGLLSLDVLRRSAEDITTLNQQRLDLLRSKDLINRPVERVHAACRDHLEAAAQARAQDQVRTAAAHEAVAAVLGYRAQVPLREGANDLLRAVVILLILAIPFAFAVERLVLGAVSIYRQIMGFSAIFVTTFLALYVTHPAFALANAPIIIFLAFVIILLSGFVISVVMGKFKHELKALQGLSQRAHSTGGGQSTTLAAIIIGIAGMRNRPLKTALTIITVTLLTFTILVFASFESGNAVVESYLGRARGADRIELHQSTFLRIPERLVDAIDSLHGDDFEVVRRTGVFRDPLGSNGTDKLRDPILVVPQDGRLTTLNALLGLDPREIARLPADLLPALADQGPGQPPPLFLSETIATSLDLVPGTELRIHGQVFRFAGAFAEERLRGVENIDGTRLMMPDFAATQAAVGSQSGNQAVAFNDLFSNLDPGSFIFTSPALIAITTNDAVLGLGGMTSLVALYPRHGKADLGRAASDVASYFNGPVYATAGDGARKYFYTRELTGSGYGDLLVPLLLGGLIIFSSLLGSIVDRQKEIFTYSALGLSPRDVGMLFFAESAVIAVVGGMGGYLIGQGASKILNLLSREGLISVPDMNFSSLSSLVTILIVMAMVLLSTIYPALVASRSANPGVNRAWKMPKPEGDRLVFTFPFTVPEASFGGIVAFIREHFSNHSDAALDVFAAKNVALFRVDDKRVGIRAEVALAPFDLGVYQRFAMRARPSDIPGIDEVVVEIERVNGHASTWIRGNLAFIKDLREQFLIWRSLPSEAVEHYQTEAGQVLAEAAGGAHG